MEKEVLGNPAFSIRIMPIAFEPDEIFSSATLVITYTKTYPRSAPKIDIVEHKGFSDKEKEDLLKVLSVVARNSVGDVMVHVLATETGATTTTTKCHAVSTNVCKEWYKLIGLGQKRSSRITTESHSRSMSGE